MIDVNNLNGLICCTIKLLFNLFVEINPIHHSRWIEPNNFWQLSWLQLHIKADLSFCTSFLVHGFYKLPETTRTSETSMFKDIIGLCKFGKEWNIINHDFTKNIFVWNNKKCDAQIKMSIVGKHMCLHHSKLNENME